MADEATPVAVAPAPAPATGAAALPPSTVAEVQPPKAKPVPEVPTDPPVDPNKKNENFLPGWPRTRFHPVFGEKAFKDPYEAAEYGQDDESGDWRFKTAADADAARTETEAQIVIHQNVRSKLDAHKEAGRTVIQNSVQATNAAKAGGAEPGLETMPKDD